MSGLSGLAGIWSRPANQKGTRTANRPNAPGIPNFRPSDKPFSGPPPEPLDATAVVAAFKPGAPPAVVEKGMQKLSEWNGSVYLGYDGSPGAAALRQQLAELNSDELPITLFHICTLMGTSCPDLASGLLQDYSILQNRINSTSVPDQASALAVISALVEPTQAKAPKLTAPDPNLKLPVQITTGLQAPTLQTAVNQALDRSGPVWTLVQTSLDAGLPDREARGTDPATEAQIQRLLLALKARGRLLRILIQWTEASEGPRVPVSNSDEQRTSDLLRHTLHAHEDQAFKLADKYMRAVAERKEPILRGDEDAWVSPILSLIEMLAAEITVAALDVKRKERLVRSADAPLPRFLELLSHLVSPVRPPPRPDMFYIPGFTTAAITRDALHTDRGTQYLLAEMLQSLPAYPPPVGSDEDQQLDRLRKLADVGKTHGCGDISGETVDRDTRTGGAAERCERLITSGATRLASSLMFLRRNSSTINTSQLVRSALAAFVDDLTRKSNKELRGEMMAQGVHRVASEIAVCAFDWPNTPPRQMAEMAPGSFTHAARAVARFGITADPKLVWPQEEIRVNMLFLIIMLWQGNQPQSVPLDKFEATLALTNFAAISKVWANRTGHLPGTSATPGGKKLREVLVQRIVSEDSMMLRRAYVELLLNLTEDPETTDYLNGGHQFAKEFLVDYKAGEQLSMPPQFLTQWVHMMFALSAPQGKDEKSGETGLPTRKAACAVLAAMTPYYTVAWTTFGLKTSTFALLAKCVCRPMRGGPLRIKDTESKGSAELVGRSRYHLGWAGEDQILDDEDMASDPKGPDHARSELALRAITAVFGISQFVTGCPPGRTRKMLLEVVDTSQTAVEVKRMVTLSERLASGSVKLDCIPEAVAETRDLWNNFHKVASETTREFESMGLDCDRLGKPDL